jgi:N utilization substance protein B
MPDSASDPIGHRHRGREAALQALYLWEIGGVTTQQALGVYFREHAPDADEPTRAFATRLVQGAADDLAPIDELIGRHSENWRVERLAVIDRLILRMAVWELRHETETPPAVVINEAIELARRFGTDNAVRFVNGVLDAIHKGLKAEAGRPRTE